MIPVIFHNLKGYDSHLIMQYVSCEYAPNSIDVIPTTSEKFFSFQIGNLRFLESLQFLTASLDTLVQSLAVDCRDKFSHTARHYPDSELVFSKENYPYEYMDGREKFLLTELPLIDAFYSSLSEETITRELRKCGENSTLTTCSNITTSTSTSTFFFRPMFSKISVKLAS